MNTRIAAALAALCAAPLVLSGLAAQAPAAAPTGFVLRIGRDTFSVERFSRSGDKVEGQCLTRSPGTMLFDYAVQLNADGTAKQFQTRLGGNQVTVAFAGDTATITTGAAATDSGAPAPEPNVRRVPAAAALPNISGCWAFMELATRRFVTSGAPEVQQTMLGARADSANLLPLARVSMDSVTITPFPTLTYRVQVDAQGRVLGARWPGEWRLSRVGAPDMAALATAWADRPLGPLSPADSVSGMVGTASIRVNYARPAARGRSIFGGVVPWNAVWRTGANEATVIETSADLVIGGTAVPAGKYSLWTIPAPGAWTLIINRNTGQWGTDYDAQYDLVKIPMRVSALTTPVERLTIAVEGGNLAVSWDRTKASVALAQK